jgi:TRAP-type C4-dicarboxylate transport system permease small subunit
LPLSKLDRLLDRLVVSLAWVAGGFVIFMWISINFEVVMRYFLLSPTSWVTDFSLYFILYITFLGTAWVLKKDGHVKIELLLNALPPGVRRPINTITSILGALVCAVLFWYSLTLTVNAFQTQALFVKSVIVPRWPVYVVMPLGFILLVFQFLRRAWQYAVKGEIHTEVADSATPEPRVVD